MTRPACAGGTPRGRLQRRNEGRARVARGIFRPARDVPANGHELSIRWTIRLKEGLGMQTPAIVIGVLASVAGLALLRAAWARKQGGLLIAAAWSVIAASLAAWTWVGGESGFAHGLAVFCALAAAYVIVLLVQAGVRVRAPAKAKSNGAEAPSAYDHRAWVFVVHALAATIVTSLVCGLCYALLARAGFTAPDALVAAGVLAPLLWAGLVCWLLMDAHVLRRVLGLVALAAFGAAALVVR